MTDNEIIKALECCGTKHTNDLGSYSCLECPMFSLSDNKCADILHDISLDLITRQKAEIGQLEKLLESRHRVIESLENQLIGLPDEVRCETIQEFVAKLKESAYESSDWSHGAHPMVVEVDDIDNLAEEMEGENDG